MQGVILAGGLGTRLRPTTYYLNKHVCPVGGEPLILHPIRTLVRVGVRSILICSNGDDRAWFLDRLCSGSDFGCSLYYTANDDVKGSYGTSQTLLSAERFVDGKNFAFIHGDSVYFPDVLLPQLEDLPAPHVFVMPLDDFDDPRKYGQVKFFDHDQEKRVRQLVVKPEQQVSNIIQTPFYVLTAECFDFIRQLQMQIEGEVHSDLVIQEYVKRGDMHCTMLPPRAYIDCGTWYAIRKADELLRTRKYH